MTIIKSADEIAIMREAGRIVAIVLQSMSQAVKPGVKTRQLNDLAEDELAGWKGAIASFKGYNGFPASICVSVNDEIVHGIPDNRMLKEGDIISLDFGVIYKGFQGDAAVTVGVGRVSPEANRLIEVTRASLMQGIAAACEGGTLGDIGSAIQTYVEQRGYNVVREYSGHGIGRDMHEDPLVPNFGNKGEGLKLKEGMTLALEPMVNVGGWKTRQNANGWTVHTADHSLSAHFEHTIAIRRGDAQILTIP
ncbi:MAG: type I methionyl aminopeptidase [Dehalococcoidia bacterium]|nr:type I methionyl aminopeptidase [Dehalococcoidia bacterium]